MMRHHYRQDLKSGQTLHYITYHNHHYLPTVVYIYELTVEKLFIIHLCSVHSTVYIVTDEDSV